MNAWEMETARIREITRQTAGLVAAELGDGWTVDTSAEFDEYRVTYVDGPNRARLSVGLDWRNLDRVEVSGLFHHLGNTREVYPSPERQEIGVRRDRGPAVIAREITRRLLPGYLAELERVAAKLEENDDARGTREKVAGELVALVPGASMPSHWQGETRAKVWLPDGSAELNYRGDSVSLELRSVPTDVARAMLAVYAEGLRK